MGQEERSSSRWVGVGWWVLVGVLALLLIFPMYAAANLWYYESKGPFKNWAQAVDLDADGNLDVVISHTRWEENDLSWAGVGRWINQGDGRFELAPNEGTDALGGFAAGAGDVDQDDDVDVFTQDFPVKLRVNQGGRQGGEAGTFKASGGIEAPPAYGQGYRDMGGTITMGDLNGDGRIDAFLAGCCYGMNAREAGYEDKNAPSVSWVWINEGMGKHFISGHILRMDTLDGVPIRQAALGDVDGDGDLDALAAVGKPTMGTSEMRGGLLLLNDGTGRLEAGEQRLGEADSTSAALGDVNGSPQTGDANLRLDALVGTNDGARLWINQGGGANFAEAEERFEAERSVGERLGAGFSAAAEGLFGLYFPYGSVRTKAVFLEDLDQDGDLDALIARTWWAEIWWNDGQGGFSRGEGRFEYPEDTGVAVADFDGDGDKDIFAGGNGENYRVWLNEAEGRFREGG